MIVVTFTQQGWDIAEKGLFNKNFKLKVKQTNKYVKNKLAIEALISKQTLGILTS